MKHICAKVLPSRSAISWFLGEFYVCTAVMPNFSVQPCRPFVHEGEGESQGVSRCRL